MNIFSALLGKSPATVDAVKVPYTCSNPLKNAVELLLIAKGAPNSVVEAFQASDLKATEYQLLISQLVALVTPNSFESVSAIEQLVESYPLVLQTPPSRPVVDVHSAHLVGGYWRSLLARLEG